MEIHASSWSLDTGALSRGCNHSVRLLPSLRMNGAQPTYVSHTLMALTVTSLSLNKLCGRNVKYLIVGGINIESY
jgi:hypothetical protein